MTLRGVASMVGKGDCYKANFELFVELVNAGEEAYLCHGIVTAAPYYKHMKPGTKFMHAWVEANHPEHGWKVGDASLGDLSFHPRKMWREGMKPSAVHRMNASEASFHANRTGNYGGWSLHPSHDREWLR